jgi:hypothetical protein
MSNPVDLTEQRFGMLLAIERLPRYKNTARTYYRCRCDCGNERIIPHSHLQQRIIRSCGCRRATPYEFRLFASRSTVINKLWSSYRHKAKKRKILWELTKPEFDRLLSKPCRYCGYQDESKIMGIDRKVGQKGYTVKNCVSCCRDCNFAKNSKNVDEFLLWANRLIDHQRKLKEKKQCCGSPQTNI